MDAVPVNFDEGMLDVGDGHSIYWRAQGPRDAPALLVVHGGPGGAMNVKWAEVLGAHAWRVVFFDQRGCGKSTPFGKLEHNGLDALVGDMEKLRVALGIERWALFGGSWGTTLGLAYGVAHPERCTGFLLRGVFLARQEDIDWFLWDVRRVFPDAHRAFLDAIEAACGQRPANAQEILTLTEAPLARFDEAGARLARAWTLYETTLSVVNKPATEPADEDKRPSAEANAAAVSMALLERHYMAEELPPTPLLPRVARIAHLPCRIVHGRFDMVCPADQAVALAAQWPGAELAVVSGAGHWTFEPGNVAALRAGAAALAEAVRGV
ncbi:prolyl aminopeptidase [Caballeronia sp. BCC1704]|uniref:prolyl aminopeptidase n=1 Tax=Caballeronia sp. BCC1704 TaxID=2676300 RepID=UPI00158985BD|nr:prolyl aminopeptidase [Caballeronia sp. BCC1704]